MAVRSGVRLEQSQRLALTPAMRTSLALLRLPAESLREEIARMADENPFLIVRDRRKDAARYGPVADIASPEDSLAESLSRQIRAQRLDPGTEAAALLLAGELREDGYLDVTVEDLAAETGLDIAVLNRGLAALQRCEPSGVGARTLAECLALQLVDAGHDERLVRKAVDHLGYFADGNWPRLARILGITIRAAEKLGAAIRGCRPVPAEPAGLPPAARVPDLVAARRPDGTVRITLNPDIVPAVAAMPLPERAATDERIGALAAGARAFASALAARRDTLRRVGAYLAETQAGFFDPGAPSLRPDSRAEAARRLGLHPSTLGRAVAGKSLLHAGRVVPLDVFFSPALPAGAGLVSAFDIQRRIRAIVAAENPSHPLADDAIAAQLKEEGVDIARRTVAKYRKWMRIPSSYERRRRNPPAAGRGAHR